MAYGLDELNTEDLLHVLVFQLDEHFLDVTILSVDHGIFEVVSTAHDALVGGGQVLALDERRLTETIRPTIDRALANGTLTRQDVAHVAFVGGTTRLPRVASAVSAIFDGRVDLHRHLQVWADGSKAGDDTTGPEVAIAYGCAVQGARMRHTCTDDCY